MASINFIPNQTVIPSSWLNDINNFFYVVLNGAGSPDAVRTNIDAVSRSGDSTVGNYDNTGDITNIGNINTSSLSTTGAVTVGTTLGVTGATTLNGATISGTLNSTTIANSGNISCVGLTATTVNTTNNGVTNLTVSGTSNLGAFTSATTPISTTNNTLVATTAFLQTHPKVAKAWVNFSGVIIQDSLGVTSVTNSSTGVYVVNFTTSFTNNRYVVAGLAESVATGSLWVAFNTATPKLNSSCTIRAFNSLGLTNTGEATVVFFGNQ